MLTIIKISLWAFTIVSAYAIGCVGLQIFPCVGESENSENVNAVALNLSYSYIAGCIFYILTSYFPYLIKAYKFRNIIVEKSKIIKGKIEDSMKSVFPMFHWDGLVITEEILRKEFSNKSIHSPSAYSAVNANSTILNHLLGQRENIKLIIANLLEYKEYMSLKEIERLESIRESTYFYLLSSFQFGIMDNPQIREQLAHELWNTYQIAMKLKI